MHARGFLIRGSGLVVLSLTVFYGCGGLNEPDVTLDGATLAIVQCGNGALDPHEDCDGNLFGGKTCGTETTNSAPRGSLSCTSKCKIDKSDCTSAMGSGGSGTGGGFGNGGAFGTGGRMGGNGGAFGTGGRMGGNGGMTGGGVQCTSDATCSRNRVCCGTQQGAFACQQSCGQNDVPTSCGKPSDCPNGQVCCGTLNGTGSAYTALSCAAQCGGGGGTERILCTSNSDCTVQGTRCQASTLLPSAFQVCR